MKKLLGLSLLAVTMLSGCAVYPSGYVETSDYTYSQPYGSVYMNETYINRFPDTYIWVNREPRWHNYPYYNRPTYSRPPINRPYPHNDHPRGDNPRDDNNHHIPQRDNMNHGGNHVDNNGGRNRFNIGPAGRPTENNNK